MVRGMAFIVVLGMHRSGTSLCASVLQALGVDMAEAPGPGPANLRGHYERSRIVDLNDRVLAMFGRGWDSGGHVLAMPERWMEDARVGAVRAELAAYCRALLAGGGPVGFKDPRTIRLLPLWRTIFAELGVAPRFVYCVRDPAQVARSVATRDAFAAEQADYRWALYNAEMIAGIGADPVCIVPYESWFTAPAETAARLAVHGGLDTDPARCAAALADTLDPALRHDGPGAAPIASRRLHRLILRCVPQGAFDADLRAYAQAFGEFTRLAQPLLVGAEIARVSMIDQARVIGDLNALIERLRRDVRQAA